MVRAQVKSNSREFVRGSRGATVSVVFASQLPRAEVERCLGVLVPQLSTTGAELVVVRVGPLPPAIVARKSSANVKFVPAPPDATLEDMRSLGTRAAVGDVVIVATEVDATAPGFGSRVRAIAAAETHGATVPRMPIAPERTEAIRSYLGSLSGR